MLYIHKLSQLSSKSAEVESVYLIRDLKQKTPFPFAEIKLQERFSEFFVSITDKEMLEEALPLIQPTIEALRQIQQENDPLHEPISLKRAIQILTEIPDPLVNNIAYLDEMLAWQEAFASQATAVLNSIPKLRTTEEKQNTDKKISALFEQILRNKEFAFRYQDIIHEAQVAQMVTLSEGMTKGFLFHISLEEELKKVDFMVRKERIPLERLQQAEQLQQQITSIKRGVDRAYDLNMRMVNWGLVLYSYVKWLVSEKC